MADEKERVSEKAQATNLPSTDNQRELSDGDLEAINGGKSGGGGPPSPDATVQSSCTTVGCGTTHEPVAGCYTGDPGCM